MDELAFTRKKIPGFKTLAEEDQARIDAAKAKGPMTNADIAAEIEPVYAWLLLSIKTVR